MEYLTKKYSIIIPHYEDTIRLKRLINSIPASRNDIEIIVIDDCSPRKADLLKIKENYNINLHFTPYPQSGAGAARNIGLKKSTGKYLIFADSDDFFTIDAFEILDKTLDHSNDLTYYYAKAVVDGSMKSSIRADYLNQLFKDYKDKKISDSYLKMHHVVPWAKVYNRDFINEICIFFDETHVSNDVKFNVIAALKAKKFKIIENEIYVVTRSPGSLTSKKNKDRFIQRLNIAISVAKEISDLGFRENRSGIGLILKSTSYGLSIFIKTLYLVKKSNLRMEIPNKRLFNSIKKIMREKKELEN